MSLLDLGSLAEGLQKGLLNYQQQQDRKRQIQNETQDRVNKNLEFQASLKKQGLLKDDSGGLQYDPVEQTKRTVDAYEGMDKLAKSGYFPKYDEKGLLSGFNEDPAKFKDYQNARKNPLEEELTRAKINELNSQATKNLAGKNSGVLTKGNENVDKAFAKEYVDYQLMGGKQKVQKNINEFKDIIKDLESGKRLTGPGTGFLANHPSIGGVLNPDAVKTYDRVRAIVNENLRATLGAAFTEKEGERFLQSAYNPNLPEKENARRLRAALQTLEKTAKDKENAINYYEKNGTVAGLKTNPEQMSQYNPPQNEDQNLMSKGLLGSPENVSAVKKLSPEDKEALDWANKNPGPKASEIKKLLGV